MASVGCSIIGWIFLIPHHEIVMVYLEMASTSLVLFISTGILQAFWGQGRNGDCGEQKQ